MMFLIKDFLSKCDQILRKLGIWSYLLKKSLMENFIFLCSEISASPEAYLRPCEISMMDSYCENIGQYLLVCSLCKNGVISDVYGNIPRGQTV